MLLPTPRRFSLVEPVNLPDTALPHHLRRQTEHPLSPAELLQSKRLNNAICGY
jgi:hypothetical protein